MDRLCNSKRPALDAFRERGGTNGIVISLPGCLSGACGGSIGINFPQRLAFFTDGGILTRGKGHALLLAGTGEETLLSPSNKHGFSPQCRLCEPVALMRHGLKAPASGRQGAP